MTGRVKNSEGPSAGRMAAWAGATGLLLLVPLVAMRFTDAVVWEAGDFALAGGLIFGAGLAYELFRTARSGAYRAGLALALAASLVLVWANLAVGIVGNEANPANLKFFAVPPVWIAVGALARFRPGGMAVAVAAAALAQVAVAAIAWREGHEVYVLTGVFVGLWLTSAGLFARAARRRPAAKAG